MLQHPSVKCVTLCVHEDNKDAQAAYLSIGFQPPWARAHAQGAPRVGKRKVGDREDEWWRLEGDALDKLRRAPRTDNERWRQQKQQSAIDDAMPGHHIHELTNFEAVMRLAGTADGADGGRQIAAPRSMAEAVCLQVH